MLGESNYLTPFLEASSDGTALGVPGCNNHHAAESPHYRVEHGACQGAGERRARVQGVEGAPGWALPADCREGLAACTFELGEAGIVAAVHGR